MSTTKKPDLSFISSFSEEGQSDILNNGGLRNSNCCVKYIKIASNNPGTTFGILVVISSIVIGILAKLNKLGIKQYPASFGQNAFLGTSFAPLGILILYFFCKADKIKGPNNQEALKGQKLCQSMSERIATDD